MTPAQKKLIEQIKANNNERFGLRSARNGFKTAQVLIDAGVLVDVTQPSDYTKFVKLANT